MMYDDVCVDFLQTRLISQVTRRLVIHELFMANRLFAYLKQNIQEHVKRVCQRNFTRNNFHSLG